MVPSARWLRAQNRRNQSAACRSGAGKAPSRVESKKPESRVPKKDPVAKVRVSPAEAAVKASARVAQVESRSPSVEGFIEASACSHGTNPAVVSTCQQYVARARRQLERAQSAVAEAQRSAQTL